MSMGSSKRVRLHLPVAALLHDGSKTYLQLLVLIPLLVVQLALLPALLPSGSYCNLITVWVVVNAVFLRLPKALMIALLSGLLLETHSAAPRGLYLCAYGTLVGTLYLFRKLIAWNLLSAWLTTIAAAELWLLLLESVAVAMQPAAPALVLSKCLLRLGATCLAAFILLKYTAIAARRID